MLGLEPRDSSRLRPSCARVAPSLTQRSSPVVAEDPTEIGCLPCQDDDGLLTPKPERLVKADILRVIKYLPNVIHSYALMHNKDEPTYNTDTDEPSLALDCAGALALAFSGAGVLTTPEAVSLEGVPPQDAPSPETDTQVSPLKYAEFVSTPENSSTPPSSSASPPDAASAASPEYVEFASTP